MPATTSAVQVKNLKPGMSFPLFGRRAYVTKLDPPTGHCIPIHICFDPPIECFLTCLGMPENFEIPNVLITTL